MHRSQKTGYAALLFLTKRSTLADRRARWIASDFQLWTRSTGQARGRELVWCGLPAFVRTIASIAKRATIKATFSHPLERYRKIGRSRRCFDRASMPMQCELAFPTVSIPKDRETGLPPPETIRDPG